MTRKFTYILLCILSSLFSQRCDASDDDDDVFGYIFGDDQDDLFALPKREEEATVEKAPEAAPPPAPEPVVESKETDKKKSTAESAGKKSTAAADKEVTKKTPSDAAKPEENTPNGDVGFAPLADFLKKSLPELNKPAAPVKLGTEDGSDPSLPLSDFLKFGQESLSKPKKGRRKKKRRRRYILRQMGNKSPPQALMAFGYVVNALNRGVKGLKFAVDGSTSVSKKTVETVGGANNSTIESVQTMLDSTANATRRQINSWADTLDMLRRSMSGSVKKKADKGHSITITTTSDAPIKTLATFADKWGNGGGITGQKAAAKPALIPGMVPVEVSSVDFSNFWRK